MLDYQTNLSLPLFVADFTYGQNRPSAKNDKQEKEIGHSWQKFA